jgi:hypothetical protein
LVVAPGPKSPREDRTAAVMARRPVEWKIAHTVSKWCKKGKLECRMQLGRPLWRSGRVPGGRGFTPSRTQPESTQAEADKSQTSPRPCEVDHSGGKSRVAAADFQPCRYPETIDSHPRSKMHDQGDMVAGPVPLTRMTKWDETPSGPRSGVPALEEKKPGNDQRAPHADPHTRVAEERELAAAPPGAVSTGGRLCVQGSTRRTAWCHSNSGSNPGHVDGGTDVRSQTGGPERAGSFGD